MDNKLALILAGASATGCLALAGCGGGEPTAMSPMGPPPPATEQLDTSAVLAIVQTRTSETSTPFAINGGLVEITPSNDDTGMPIPVNGS